MAEILELVTHLTADTKEFTAKIAEAEASINHFGATGNKVFTALSNHPFLAGGAAFTALSVGILEAEDKLNELYLTSQKLGTSTGKLQEFQYAMKAFGVEAGGAVTMVGMLEKAIGSARMEDEAFVKVFQQLKLNPATLSSKDSIDQMRAVIAAVHALPDQDVQAALVRKLLGRQGLAAMGAIRSGELEETLNKYAGTGVDDQLATQAHHNIEELNLTLAQAKKIGYEILGEAAKWATTLISSIKTVFDYISSAAKALGADQLTKEAPKTQEEVRKTGQSPTYFNNRAILGNQALLRSNINNTANSVANGDLKSYIPPFLEQSLVTFKSATEGATKELDEMTAKLSDISDMITESKKSATKSDLKDLLEGTIGGNDIKDALKNYKPLDNNTDNASLGNKIDYYNIKSKMAAESAQAAYESFKTHFQDVYDMIDKEGNTTRVQNNLASLKQEAQSFKALGYNNTGELGAVNDLKKYAKEQGEKPAKAEIKVTLDAGLKGQFITQEKGDGAVTITFGQLSDAAASMGK